LKISQSGEFKAKLFETWDKIFAATSHNHSIWDIVIGANNPDFYDMSKCKGKIY
jgi:hypothetical protein